MSRMHAIVHAAAHRVPATPPRTLRPSGRRRGAYLAARGHVVATALPRFRIA